MLEQINGNSEPIDTDIKVEEINYGFPERFRTAKLFLESRTASFSTIDARAAFVNDFVSLCSRLESRVNTRKRKFVHTSDKNEQEQSASKGEGDVKVMLGASTPVSKAVRLDIGSATSSIRVGCKPFQCLVCTGRTELFIEDRLLNYGSKYSLKRHFRRKHSRFDKDSARPHPDCPNVVFEFKTDFMNHAARIHGIEMHERIWLE